MKMNRGCWRLGAALMATLVLTACGGDVAEAILVDKRNSFVLSQSSTNCATDMSVACADVELSATPVHSLAQDARPDWREVPADGRTLLVDHLYRNQQADGRWALSLGFKTPLQPGIYSGEIELSVFALDLFTEYRPATLSYRIEVRPEAGNLSTLQAVAGAGDWQGSGGTAARNPVLTLNLDPSKFNRRWTRLLELDASQGFIGQRPALAAGAIYLAGARPAGTLDNVTALAEQDGSVRWSTTLPGLPRAAFPSGDQVLVQAYTAGTDSRVRSGLTSLAAATGVQRWQRDILGLSVSMQGGSVGGGLLLLGQGSDDALLALGLDDGQERWARSAADRCCLFAYNNWAAARDDRLAYTNLGGTLRAHRLADGAQAFSIAIPTRGGGSTSTSRTSMNQVPVLADATTVLSLTHLDATEGSGSDNQLSAIDLTTQSVRWTLSGQFTTQPVAAGGLFYIGNQATKQLEARSLATGALQWAWPLPDAQFRSQLVLTSGHLFLSTDRQTVALDLATHQPVWRYGLGGWLGVSPNGVLYILGSKPIVSTVTGTALVAINLR